MSETKTKIIESSTVRVSTIRHHELGEGLHAYHLTKGLYHGTDVDRQKPIEYAEKQGIVDDKNLQKLLKDPENFSDYTALKKNRPFPAFITPEGREKIRTVGNPCGHTDLFRDLTSNKELLFPDKCDFVSLAEQGFTHKDLIYLRMNDHMIVDHAGVPVPVAARFGYINGVTSLEFDLKKVLERLEQMPSVVIKAEEHSGRLIQAFPHYSQTYGNWIDVIWQPTIEDWDQVLLAYHEQNGPEITRINESELLHGIDILGIGGAEFRRSSSSPDEDEEENYDSSWRM